MKIVFCVQHRRISLWSFVSYAVTLSQGLTVCIMGWLSLALAYGQPHLSQSDDRAYFSVAYQKTPSFSQYRNDVKKSKVMENTLTEVNHFLKLPSSLKSEYVECGESNAFYDPEHKKIIICYEMVQELAQMAQAYETIDTKAQQETLNNLLTFIILHEMAHALIDLYNLPITGKEEDVADQIAVYLLAYENQQIIFDASNTFYDDLKDISAEDMPFADNHSLNRQRYYNMVCWVYGSNPDYFAYLINDGFLDVNRAPSCPIEYNKLEQGIGTLLEPYLRD